MATLPKRPPAKAYRIKRGKPAHRGQRGDVEAFVIEHDGRLRALRHIAIHSPDGFECGYAGSGPADLALSLVAHLLGASTSSRAYRVSPEGLEADAWAIHQPFKHRIIAQLEIPAGESVEIPAAELYRFVLEERARLRRPAAQVAS